jgi:hypothetical protein
VIDAQDIVERAGELSLDPTVVEKDYVLGWLLGGISQQLSPDQRGFRSPSTGRGRSA